MPKILGLSGKIGSGKTWLANALSDRYGFKVLSFAVPLKNDIVEMGFSVNEVYYEKPAPIRALLQAYGQARRYQDPNYWLERLSLAVDGCSAYVVIIDDVRFPNEADWVCNMGGTMLRLERNDMTAVSNDISETALDCYPFDAVISADYGDTNLLLLRAELPMVDRGFFK